MKQSLRYLLTAIVLLAVVITVCALAPTAAAETNVIYIADDASSGNGSGSSPENPLRAEERVTRSAPANSDAYKYYYATGADGTTSDSTKRFYFNSALYQAAEKLASTGGKIVLVGDVVIDYSKTYSSSSKTDRDFFMYTHGDKEIVITAQNDAKLVLTEGARLCLGGKTVFEDITIATGATANSTTAGVQNRSISCMGYETVFGYGVKCINLDGNTSASYYPMITGGARYGVLNKGSNVTVKSGTWNQVYGGNYNASSVMTGDANVTIEGGKILGVVVAGSRNAVHNGNATVTIKGGEIKNKITAESVHGVGNASYKTIINILDGDFSSASGIKKINGTLSNGKIAPNLTINLSETKANNLEIGYLLKDTDADTIIYPITRCIDIDVLEYPNISHCVVGEEYDPTGLKIKLTYRNGTEIYEAEVEYSDYDPNFSFEYNNKNVGMTDLVCKYSGKEICTTRMAVINGDVLYIADSSRGKGDGSSAANAMGPEIVVERDANLGTSSDDYIYYMAKSVNANGTAISDTNKNFSLNGVLYQAVEKMAETGGKIVLVGDVQLDFSNSYSHSAKDTRDINLPYHAQNPIVITSENGARLKITDGVMLSLGGPTVFDNITFATGATALSTGNSQYNRAICAKGETTIFGRGVTCVNDDGETDEKAFIGINGGTRYTNLVSDTNITVRGGKWAYLAGSSYGMTGYYHKGDIKTVVEGGEFIGYVSAVSRSGGTSIHYGNAQLLIRGGTFQGGVVGYSALGTGHKNSKVEIIVSGGNFVRTGSSAYFASRYSQSTVGTGIVPYTTLDLSDCDTFTSLSRLPNSSFDKIIFPSEFASSVTVKTNATNSECFVGEDFDASGLNVTVSYSDGSLTRSSTVAYNDAPWAFGFNVDTSKVGSASMKWLVGNVEYKTSTLNVIGVPTPELLGAQVRIENTAEDSALRFVAQLKKNYSDNVKVTEYGFIALDDEYVPNDALLVIDGFYGVNGISGSVFRADIGKVYNNDKGMTFSGTYPSLELNEYDTDISVAAYVKFTYGGKTYVRYSDVMTRSVVDVANSALRSSLESAEGKAWMQTNLISASANYTTSQLYDSSNASTLRNEVVNAYNNMATYAWVPSSSVTVGSNVYSAGTTYYGIPFVDGQRNSMEKFTSYMKVYGGKNYYMGPIAGYEEVYSGVLSSSDYNKYLPDVDEGLVTIEGFFPGCDYSVVTNAWNKVSTNKLNITTVQSFIPNQNCGTVTVGRYNCGTSNNTKTIAQTTNGQTVMNAAYVLCKPGDALISTTSSAVYMVTAAAGASSVKVCYPSETLNSSTKSHFKTMTVSFATLYNNGFIPVTIPELATGLRSDTILTLSGVEIEKAVKNGYMNGVIESNRQVISVNVSINRLGKAIYDKTVYFNTGTDTSALNLSMFNIADPVKFMVAGSEYKIKVSAVIGGLSTETTSVVLGEYSYKKPAVDKSKYASFVNTFDGYDYNSYKSDLAQAAIDYMYKEYNSFYWTPSADFQQGQKVVVGNEFVPSKTFYASNIYKGIMYADMRATYEDFRETMNGMSVNGSYTSAMGATVYTYALPSDAKYTDANGNVRYDWNMLMGNHCSAAMFHAYNQTSRIGAAGSRHNPDLKLVGFAEDIFYNLSGMLNDTRNITHVFGSAAMYASYAEAQKGDYMYRNTGGGHTRMVKEVHVEYNSNGEINPTSSWIRMLEQTDTPVLMKTLKDSYGCDVTDKEYNNPNAYSTWYMNKKYTFADLYNGNCVIYRPLEYITNESEQPHVILHAPITAAMLSGSTVSDGKVSHKIVGLVESNYPIIALKMEVKNSSGNVVATASLRALQNTYAYNMRSLANNFDTFPTAAGTYTFTLTAELSVGEAVLTTVQFTK